MPDRPVKKYLWFPKFVKENVFGRAGTCPFHTALVLNFIVKKG
jgi:hypothetical protein